MSKSKLINEDIKSISKLMGYDRGLTSVENNLLFEQKQLNEENSTIIPFENYSDVSISWDEDENGNSVISDYKALQNIASGLEDATDSPIDDEDLNDVYKAVKFLTGKYTSDGEHACKKVIEIFGDKSRGENLSQQVGFAGADESEGAWGSMTSYGRWSDDDDMKLEGRAMTFGAAKRQIQKAIKACDSSQGPVSGDKKGQSDLKSQWPDNLKCVLKANNKAYSKSDGAGKFLAGKDGKPVFVKTVSEKMAGGSNGNLQVNDRLVYYVNGTMRVYPRGKTSITDSKGPFPFNCGRTEDMEIDTKTEIQVESKLSMEQRYRLLIIEQMSDVGGVFIDFGPGDNTDTKSTDNTKGDGGTNPTNPNKKSSGTKYRTKNYTWEDILSGKVQAQIGDVIKDESGPIFKIQVTIGAKGDGVYGPKTAAAVEAFQTKNNLDVDGMFGKEEASLGGAVATETDSDKNPGAKTVDVTTIEKAKIEINDDSSAAEVIQALKGMDEKQFTEGECTDLVIAAAQALPNKEEAIMSQLQACFYNFNFPSLGKERRQVKKRYGITSKGKKR
jgi:peptidoglycan hydrolase-like protein with peptidoglycan-binding domain|tara:strand:- start:3881 stop:5551 length:1671 start_codon:yes stop_codon:yes gene_type:complete